jgi:hypothetical protein
VVSLKLIRRGADLALPDRVDAAAPDFLPAARSAAIPAGRFSQSGIEDKEWP